MYELAHVDSPTTEAMIKDAAATGFSVIRFWAFEPMSKAKISEICDLASANNIKLIAVLADTTGYLQSYKIDGNWYKDDFRKGYIKYASDMVSFFKDREEIMLWELINEPFSDSFEDFYNFAEYTSAHLKSVNSNHLLSIGTIGGIGDKFGNFFSRFSSSNFKKLYSIKTLDAISIHDYSYNSTVLERLDLFSRLKGNHNHSKFLGSLNKFLNFIPDLIDKFTLKNFKTTFDFPLTMRSVWTHFNSLNIQIARSLNKPLYIGEIGFKKSLGEYRKDLLRIALNQYFESGAAGIILWSFESHGRSIDGHDYGFNVGDGFDNVIKDYASFAAFTNSLNKG